MKQYFEKFRMAFSQGSALYRIIIINVAVFLTISLIRLIIFLFQISGSSLNYFIDKLSLPSNLYSLLLQPWSLLTYMFVHVDILHILFNMLVLFWTGNIFLQYLGGKKLVSTFILGGFTGAIMYIIAYNLFPAFNKAVDYSSLIGASAGVLAVLTAIATLLPDYQVQLLFFGPVKLKYVAAFSIVLYAISIPLGNAGGQISHLGGAFFGFVYVRQLKQGRDIAGWFNGITDLLTGGKRHKMKVSHKRQVSDEDYRNKVKSREEVIDRILDKISQSGYDSLSKEEKEILFNASRNRNA